MREIKFRAWDKAYKVMCYRDDGTQQLASWLKNADIFDVTQYIGLRDNKGVEIFQADVVIWYESQRIGSSYKDKSYEVVWDKDCLMWGFKDAGGLIQSKRPQSEYVQVIGNIYDNPNLLEASA
jgi:uncharacterized phage protein (TIGR01671 family)